VWHVEIDVQSPRGTETVERGMLLALFLHFSGWKVDAPDGSKRCTLASPSSVDRFSCTNHVEDECVMMHSVDRCAFHKVAYCWPLMHWKRCAVIIQYSPHNLLLSCAEVDAGSCSCCSRGSLRRWILLVDRVEVRCSISGCCWSSCRSSRLCRALNLRKLPLHRILCGHWSKSLDNHFANCSVAPL